MAKARTVYVTCPLCRGMLEVNTENGKVVRHFVGKEKTTPDDTLAEGLKAVRNGEALREQKFKEAQEKEKHKIQKIEGLFEKKKDEIEKSGDREKPLRPFDLE